MDSSELETYQAQLEQVEAALQADPDNQELASLRSELKQLIQLTETSVTQSEQLSSKRKQNQPIATGVTFSAGDEVLAKYSGDGNFYPARVTSVGGSMERRVYSVVFKGYNNTEVVEAGSIKTLPANYSNLIPSSSAKRKLTKEEEDERDKKKKKNEKKLEMKAAKAKEQTEKQATWQKFTKKAEKKGVVIAGVTGASIFKTPENPLGKVGVTGSGKGMTEYASRNKHVFRADDKK